MHIFKVLEEFSKVWHLKHGGMGGGRGKGCNIHSK